MLLNIIYLLAGFIILVYGANLLVDGGAALAHRLKVPNIVIGLTVVAFGTSTPELVVNIISSIEGSSALALGNVLGSNIFNIMAPPYSSLSESKDPQHGLKFRWLYWQQFLS